MSGRLEDGRWQDQSVSDNQSDIRVMASKERMLTFVLQGGGREHWDPERSAASAIGVFWI